MVSILAFCAHEHGFKSHTRPIERSGSATYSVKRSCSSLEPHGLIENVNDNSLTHMQQWFKPVEGVRDDDPHRAFLQVK